MLCPFWPFLIFCFNYFGYLICSYDIEYYIVGSPLDSKPERRKQMARTPKLRT